jgi:hypothetical protein
VYATARFIFAKCSPLHVQTSDSGPRATPPQAHPESRATGRRELELVMVGIGNYLKWYVEGLTTAMLGQTAGDAPRIAV